MEVKVIKSNEAKVFMDGPEICREYIKTNKITFGTSSLLSGQTMRFFTLVVEKCSCTHQMMANIIN